uniref:Reverse transcriptase domain-containing protein n=1 Tax=Haemonchus contortus TaxID=6289 RepID=A0A7I4YGJ3_HAECO
MLAEFDSACGKIGLRLNLTKTIFMKNGLSYAERRAAWGAFKNIERVVKKTKNIRLCAHIFDTAVLPALSYASETWTLRKHDEHAVSKGIRSSELRHRTKIRDAVDYATKSKIRWAGHVVRYSDDRWTRAVTDWIPWDIKRTPGRPPKASRKL